MSDQTNAADGLVRPGQEALGLFLRADKRGLAALAFLLMRDPVLRVQVTPQPVAG